jgi:uncharacterized protein
VQERYIICPWCHAEMDCRDQNGVEIDQCPNCLGVWLDQGELETLLKQTDEVIAPSDSGPPSDSADRSPNQEVARNHLFEWF